MKENKRGISPVIATILLVVIAIALFAVIYVWITSLQKDTIIKFDSGIQQACLRINSDVVGQGNTVQVQNKGDVPLYKVILYKKTATEMTNIGEVGGGTGISSGEAANLEGADLSGCLQIKAVPILLGISKKTGSQKEYTCQEQTKFVGC